jgi:hypothetical protein
VLKKILFIICALFFVISNSFSQKKKTSEVQPKTLNHIVRCATDQRVEMLFKLFPEKKLLAEKLAKEIPSGKALRMPQRLQAIVTIPVVFHIVLSNPYQITDDLVKSQIDVMNTDFAGLNADSTNIPAAFQAVRGHSSIRFTLARRTPDGKLTNGIDRITSSTTGNPNNLTDSIKRTALGGADVWDPNYYLNIWVGNISGDLGVLGYTQVPGSGSPLDDGVFCNVRSFGISSCNVSNYNKGRTIVHELGHYFGINHIWGDDETDVNKCSGDDFRALTDDGSSYVLPTTLYNPHGQGNTPQDIGDTPNQAIPSDDCASGIVTDSCSAAPPGIMYENYMDYTMDNCYSLFTKKQVARMEYVLTNFRTSLMTSAGATPPANAPTIDASPIASINPGGFETTGCTSVFHPSTLTCGGNIAPKVLIKNNGITTITTITVGYVLNGGSPVQISANTNLISGQTQVITLPTIAVSTGNYTFKFFTANVNGNATDQVPANDTLTATLSVPNPVALPLSEGFENSLFPPQGWSIINPNNDVTWQRTTPGSNSAHSMFIDNFDDNPVGNIDEIRTPKLILSGTDPVVITFDLAHKNYPDAAYNDSLQVLVSTDCGATFKAYFNKAGAALSTAGTSTTSYLNPAPSDWKTQKITLDASALSSGSIIVAFRNISDWGNNIYIDNINIKQQSSRDISVVAVNPPSSIDCVEPTIPVATVKNVGFSTITGFKVSYQIDNGSALETTVSGISLPADAEINVPLATFTPSQGQHTITVFSAQPISSSGAGDESPLNDTLRKSFFAAGTVSLPVTEGFENSVFPPTNWIIENEDGGITWERTTLAAKTGNASMVIRNYNSTSTGTTDNFVSSVITGTSAFDSIFVSFDYAYAAGVSDLPDTFELQATTDCGQTFTTVWKNWGTDLQTTNNPSAGFVPSSNDWKNISINLFQFVGTKDFQLYFVDKGNRQNNLYIDNINVYGITVPARLKKQGYLFYPNPFRTQFFIRIYQVPVNLQKAQIFNSVGQLVWSKTYNGNAYTQMPVDLRGAPPGIYVVKLTFSDKTIVQKIVKE